MLRPLFRSELAPAQGGEQKNEAVFGISLRERMQNRFGFLKAASDLRLGRLQTSRGKKHLLRKPDIRWTQLALLREAVHGLLQIRGGHLKEMNH